MNTSFLVAFCAQYSANMIATPFGDATEISTQVFLEQVLPPLHDSIHFDALLEEKDVSGRSRLPVTKNGRLWGFATTKPSELKGQKLAAFHSLPVCISKVIRAVTSDPTTSLGFRNNETSEWSLDKRTADALPDAYFLLKSRRRNLVDWTTIAIPGAYSKECTRRIAQEVCRHC